MIHDQKVSVIIRSMGRPCLEDAIASAEQQRHRSLELLVVDATGGRHAPLPLPWASGGPRARLISAGRPLNRPAAANFGLENATGEWIAFLDDDDVLDPTHVGRLVARAMEPDRPTLVYGQLWGLDRFHRVVRDRHNGFNPLIMYYYCRISGMSCILHRSLRDAGHRFDETLDTSEDWEFWLRLLPHVKVATVHERSHFYFAEAGTSGTGSGRNRHRDDGQQRCHHEVVARYAIERDRAWRAYFERLEKGIALQRAGDRNAAAGIYVDALREYPDEPNALYLMAQLLQDAGRLHVSRRLLHAAIYLNGDAAPYHFALGQVCERLGANDEARDAYARAARFGPGLRTVAEEGIARIAELVASPPHTANEQPTGVGRNALCLCGSGVRFKACHGALGRHGGEPAIPRPVLERMESALAAARTGNSGKARELYADVVARVPQHAEALHALALHEFDRGDLVNAVRHIELAFERAPNDSQVAEDRQRLRLQLHGRATEARIKCEIETLSFLVPSTATLPSELGTGEVHLVTSFCNFRGAREVAALRLAAVLRTRASVTLWSTHSGIAPIFTMQHVREIDLARGIHPRSGTLIFFGLDAVPPTWLEACAASRTVVLQDADEPDLLIDLVRAAYEATSRPIQVVTPSEVFRRRCGIPAASCPLPLDIELFRPEGQPSSARPFTVGRRSANEHLLYHPDDPALIRRLTERGMVVRLLGGTVLMRYFAPSRSCDRLELLAADALSPHAFFRGIDCVFYRTSPLHIEAGGETVAEALAAGIPVVCARDVGYSELISHGIDGFVFDRDDDDAAFRHLASLHDDVGLRYRMSQAARAKAEIVFGPALHDRLRRIYLGDAAALNPPERRFEQVPA